MRKKVNKMSPKKKRIIANIKPNDLIVYSDINNLEFHDIIEQKVSSKPKGLWFAYGTAWINWVAGNMPDWERKHIYKIQVDFDNIINLDSQDGIEEFGNKYGKSIFPEDTFTAIWNRQSPMQIDWNEVSKNYSGVSIPNYQYKYGAFDWTTGFDISSGCIWNKKAILNIEKLY
jgi:hypothetical protein